MNIDILNRVSVTQWVNGTVQRVLLLGRDDAQAWNTCWFDQYISLGGTSKNSGQKPCPRAAARGLWITGRLRSGRRPFLSWNTTEVYRHLTKNAAYASIAADLLTTTELRSSTELWPLVQAEFTRCTGEPSAASEQGEVRLVVALFHSQQLVGNPVSTKLELI